MGILMNNNIVFERPVTFRLSERPEVHIHMSGLAIRRGGEVGVVCPTIILNGNGDAIVAEAAFPKVVFLEVESLLGESVSI